jgi:hypothetical protein
MTLVISTFSHNADTSPGMYYYNKDSMFNINDLLSMSLSDSWCGPVFKTILLDKLLVYFDCHHFYLLVFCLCKKKRAVILSLVIWWKLKFGSLKNIGGIYWGCRTNDYLQFSSWIFHTLNFTSISYDSSSQGGYSSLMWIQLLCKYLISPSVDCSVIK